MMRQHTVITFIWYQSWW